MSDPFDRMLRPVLEAALTEAQRGERAAPPVPAPALLRPVLGFRRPTATSLIAARRALEDSPGFRARVAQVTTENAVSRPAWLWLTRPPGWEDELDGVRSELEAVELEEGIRHRAGELERQVEVAEEARRRAETARNRAENDATLARDAVATERTSRHEAEVRAAALANDVERLTAERARAVRDLKDLEATHVVTRHELREARAALRNYEQEVARLTSRLDSPRGGGRDLPAQPVPAAAGPHDQDAPQPAAAPVGAGPESVALAAALARAGAAVSAAGHALADAARALAPDRSALDEDGSPSGGPGSTGMSRGRPAVSVGAGRDNGPVATGEDRTRRRPAGLPRAMFEESVEAADYLVRLPGAIVLVDGYNVSMGAWPGEPIEEQRRRLVMALDEFHARTGADPVVVFDGVAAGGVGSGSRHVRVRFTDAEVEADDVVVDLVGEYPVNRPVVVVSSDERVRQGARGRGANVVSSEQFLVVLRR